MTEQDPLEARARELVRGFAWRRWPWLRTAVLERAGDEDRAVEDVLLDSAMAGIYLALYDEPDAPERVFRRAVYAHVESDFAGGPRRGRTAVHVPLTAVVARCVGDRRYSHTGGTMYETAGLGAPERATRFRDRPTAERELPHRRRNRARREQLERLVSRIEAQMAEYEAERDEEEREPWHDEGSHG